MAYAASHGELPCLRSPESRRGEVLHGVRHRALDRPDLAERLTEGFTPRSPLGEHALVATQE